MAFRIPQKMKNLFIWSHDFWFYANPGVERYSDMSKRCALNGPWPFEQVSLLIRRELVELGSLETEPISYGNNKEAPGNSELNHTWSSNMNEFKPIIYIYILIYYIGILSLHHTSWMGEVVWGGHALDKLALNQCIQDNAVQNPNPSLPHLSHSSNLSKQLVICWALCQVWWQRAQQAMTSLQYTVQASYSMWGKQACTGFTF